MRSARSRNDDPFLDWRWEWAQQAYFSAPDGLWYRYVVHDFWSGYIAARWWHPLTWWARFWHRQWRRRWFG